MMELLAMLVPAMLVNENITIYPLLPTEAGQGWKLELFVLAEPLEAHYHKIQRQFILVAEGELNVRCGTAEPVILHGGDLVCINPGILHAAIPTGKVRFLALDLPGFNFPEDVFFDEPQISLKWTPPNIEQLPQPLNEKYFGAKFEKGDYTVYDLVCGSTTEEKWSVALLEIKNSPKHFHRIEKEHFIVVKGTLDIEIDGQQRFVETGESITILPEQIHQLKSAKTTPVQVLCFSFPAFDPTDLYCVE